MDYFYYCKLIRFICLIKLFCLISEIVIDKGFYKILINVVILIWIGDIFVYICKKIIWSVNIGIFFILVYNFKIKKDNVCF